MEHKRFSFKAYASGNTIKGEVEDKDDHMTLYVYYGGKRLVTITCVPNMHDQSVVNIIPDQPMETTGQFFLRVREKEAL